MAAIVFVFGGVLGCIVAAATLVAGALASTALIVFTLTSLCFGFSTLFLASLRSSA